MAFSLELRPQTKASTFEAASRLCRSRLSQASKAADPQRGSALPKLHLAAQLLVSLAGFSDEDWPLCLRYFQGLVIDSIDSSQRSAVTRLLRLTE